MWEVNESNQAILEYLEKFHKEELEKAKVDESKSAKALFEFILGKARERLNRNNGMIADDVVYGWAVHYLIEDSESLKKEVKSVSSEKARVSKVEEVPKPKEPILEDVNQVSFDFL